MGVYIKGMEMPKCCGDCDFLYDYFSCMATGESMALIYWELGKKRLPNCPLVEVPDHGDLIEAHSLKIRLGQRFNLDERRVMEIVRETVDTAKVVIPAEKSK